MPVLLPDSPSPAADMQQAVVDTLRQEAVQENLAVAFIDQEAMRAEAQKALLSGTLNDGTDISVHVPEITSNNSLPYIDRLEASGIRLVEPTEADASKMSSIIAYQTESSQELRGFIGNTYAFGDLLEPTVGLYTAGDVESWYGGTTRFSEAFNLGSGQKKLSESTLGVSTAHLSSYIFQSSSSQTNPAEALRQVPSDVQVSSPELRRKDSPDQFFPYSLDGFWTEKGDIGILVFDHIRGEEVLQLYVDEIDFRSGRVIDPSILSKYIRLVTAEVYAQNEVGYQDTLNSWMSQGSEVQKVFSIDPGQTVSDSSFIALIDLTDNYDVSLTCVGTEREYDVGSGNRYDELGLRPLFDLTSEMLERTDQHPIVVDGQIEAITVTGEVSDRKRFLELSEQVLVDRYQHNILVTPRNTSSGMMLDITTYIPTTFLENASSAPQFVPVNFDLTPFAGDVEGAFYHRALSPIDELDGIKFYTNMTAQQVLAEYGDSFSDVIAGIHDALNLFGQSGDVKRVLIANGSQENAYFTRINPESICLFDELVEPGAKIIVVSRHETFHLLDSKCDFALSGGRFEKVFQRLKNRNASFLNEICESEFLPNMENAGHAFDNKMELLSSIGNSLHHPEWSQAVAERSLEFIQDYRKVLEALQHNVSSIEEIPDDAPIHVVLEKRIAELKDLERSKRREEKLLASR